MVGRLKSFVVAAVAAAALAGPPTLIATSASATGWHGYTYGRYHHARYYYLRYYHPRYYYYYGYWPRTYYYAYGPPPLLGALAAIALAPAALLAPRPYYYGPPYYDYAPGPYGW
jgi:hypothetical protein